MDTNELADLCFVHPQTIRYWEKKGWIPQADRPGGPLTKMREGIICRRYWTEEQVDIIVKFSDARYNTKRGFDGNSN